MFNITGEKQDFIGEDGLLHCAKCGTPKQFRLLGSTLPVMCSCEEKRYNDEQRALADMQQRVRIDRMRQVCFDEPHLLGWTFAHDDGGGSLMQTARNFAERFAEMPKGLLLYGGLGCGKSYGAASICNYLLDSGISCRMLTTAALIAGYSSAIDKAAFLDDLNRAELLVLDDLGAERSTDYAKEILFEAVDVRYRSGRRLIVTTNFTAEQIKDKGSRTMSRILDMCHPVQCTGADRRRAAAVADAATMNELLGIGGKP